MCASEGEHGGVSQHRAAVVKWSTDDSCVCVSGCVCVRVCPQWLAEHILSLSLSPSKNSWQPLPVLLIQSELRLVAPTFIRWVLLPGSIDENIDGRIEGSTLKYTAPIKLGSFCFQTNSSFCSYLYTLLITWSKVWEDKHLIKDQSHGHSRFMRPDSNFVGSSVDV